MNSASFFISLKKGQNSLALSKKGCNFWLLIDNFKTGITYRQALGSDFSYYPIFSHIYPLSFEVN